MNVLILGSNSQVGKYLSTNLSLFGFNILIPKIESESEYLDTDLISEYCLQADTLIICYALDQRLIIDGTKVAIEAAFASNKPNIIFVSSTAVYGGLEGSLDEDSNLDPDYNTYTLARCNAEAVVAHYVNLGGKALILRPGCIVGIGEVDWAQRVSKLLIQKKLGYLGKYGDGWTNLTSLEDISLAVTEGVRYLKGVGQQKKPAIYNIVMLNSPRWNDFIQDLAIGLEKTPIETINIKRLKCASLIYSIVFKIKQLTCNKLLMKSQDINLLSPSFINLLAKQARVKAASVERDLNIKPTNYNDYLKQSLTDLKARVQKT